MTRNWIGRRSSSWEEDMVGVAGATRENRALAVPMGRTRRCRIRSGMPLMGEVFGCRENNNDIIQGK